MSNNLIFETLNDVKSMKATRDSNGFMHLEGVFGVCGVKNNNQRIYQKDNYAKMVEALQKRIETEGCPGELEHPSTMNITLENVSHKIDSISIDENGVVSGSITLLDTPKGLIAQKIVEGGLPLFISSRAQGNVDQRTGIVTLENLKTFDLVGSPGFSEARLHIHLNEGQVLESITDNCYMIAEETEEKKEEHNIMTEQEMNRLNELEEKVGNLTDALERVKKENAELKDTIKESEDSVKHWAMTDLSNAIEKWINEVYQSELVTVVTERLAPAFQQWVIEEFSPEVENWLVEQFSPKLESWVCEEYSNELQNWITEQLCPEIEKWVVEEYSDGLQGWIDEHLKPEISQMITESKKTSLDSIDQTLKLLESSVPSKQTYSRKQTVVTEANADEPLYIQKMPAEKRPAWNLLNEDVKEMVRRRASLRDLSTDENIENFWESIDFDSIKPAKPINEGLESISDDYERQLRNSIRGWRRN